MGTLKCETVVNFGGLGAPNCEIVVAWRIGTLKCETVAIFMLPNVKLSSFWGSGPYNVKLSSCLRGSGAPNCEIVVVFWGRDSQM